jgi:acetyl/propionyl-CoA carboxylase alpha subunit
MIDSLWGNRRMFRRVLVANRGEIAVRVIRAIHELGAEAVAVFSDADRGARHVRMADYAVRLGRPPAAESYLNATKILDAARATGADAIHPGYGFLSERAEFARACAEAGVAFVGPSPDTLEVTGDKVAARALAIRAGARLVPGTPGPVDTEAAAITAATQIGYPLLIKAASGGGGKGMQVVRNADGFAEALASSQRIALASFGDGSVYLERLVERPRHVEVQIFGDGHGDVVAIGDRDCSIQRRYQKVIEEAPAPDLDTAVRTRLHADAIAIGQAAKYAGAGTVEFLYDPVARDIYFLEVNARLQVEHPVTEQVTGVDLVHAQLRLASGAPMREALTLAGWSPVTLGSVPPLVAIEARICAEDPGAGWAPSAGRLGIVREPSGPWVRVDSACEPGLEVGIDYDSLLAKVVAWGPTRTIALDRLRRALDEHVVTGVATTLSLHRWIVRHPDFAAGAVSTAFLADNWQSFAHENGDPAVAAAAVAVVRAARQATLANRGPSSQRASSEVTPWHLAARREAIRGC